MEPKPAQWSREHAQAWDDADAARSYLARPAYPAETFEVLAGLGARGGRVLDVGTGTGELARRLVGTAREIDAVDPSAAMLALARGLERGDHPSIRWIHGTVKHPDLAGPYEVAVAGDSIHWLDWEPAFRRLAELLMSSGRLVLLTRKDEVTPWREELREVIARFSVNPAWQPLDLVGELQARGLFHLEGRHETGAHMACQSLERYLDLLHSRSSLSRARLGVAASRAFDAEVAQLVAGHLDAREIRYPVTAVLTWGRV